MKKLYFIICTLAFITVINAQDYEEIHKYADNVEKQRAEYWKAKEFAKAADLLKQVVTFYNSQTKEVQNEFVSYYSGTLYNLACALSLDNQKDSALVYLQKACNAGYKNYYNTRDDADFNNIKNEPKFQEILNKLKEKGDYEYILKKYASYSKIDADMPAFTFQQSNAKELAELRKKYNLDSAAGGGNEISRFINLMKWVHKIVKHDGSSMNPKIRTADALITVCKTENRGVNCRMMATILNEVYLSMGYKSRFITCMPQGEKFDDCHVINEVYSVSLNKWLWMDPTFETCVTDDKGNYLSIQETRLRLVNNLPVNASKEINWNGQPYGGGGEKYLKQYMTKNLFRFSIPLNSCSGFEDVPKEKRVYVELFPAGYNPSNIELGKITKGSYYTTDDVKYWAAPTK